MAAKLRLVDNTEIADRLETFALMLELVEANPYTIRAYRRAAETIRTAPVPVADLVRSKRVRELRGIGDGIAARLSELIETGQIAELAELERELSPDLVGLGRYLGLGARRSVELARALDVRTADELREAAASGRLRELPGIGAKTEALLLEALANEQQPRPREGLLLNRARELVGAVATALGGEPAGDVRRWRDSCEWLAVVCAAPDPKPVLDRFTALPQIVALLERADRRAVGVTIEGVPLEVVAAEPALFGTALVRATGSPAYVAALEPLPDAPDEQSVYDALALPFCPPELREQPFAGEPPALVEVAEIRGDLHFTRRGRMAGRASRRWAGRRATAATTTWRSATTPPPSAQCAGSRRTTCAGRARRSPPPTSCSRRSAYCVGSSATSSPTDGSIFPMTSCPSSTGSRPACTAGSGCRRRR